MSGVVPLVNLSMLGDGDSCPFVKARHDQPLPSFSDPDYAYDPTELPPR